MVVKDFEKFLKRRVRFVRQPRNDKKTFQRIRDDKNGKSDRKCFRCGDPNHLIGECPKPPKDKNQRAFVIGSWRDSEEEDDEKIKDEMCVAQTSNKASELAIPNFTPADQRSTLSPIECLELCSLDARMIVVIVGEFDQRRSPSDTTKPASQYYSSFSSARSSLLSCSLPSLPRSKLPVFSQIIMENLPSPNDNQNAPEEEPFMDQAPAAFDGFAPHWFDPEVNEEVMDDDDWDVEVEWLMASVTPQRATMTVPSTYKVGGPSTIAIEGPYFPLPAPGLHVPPTVIEDLGNRLGNLEYRHGVLTRKMEEVMESQTVQVVSRLEEIKTRVQQVEIRLDTYPSGQMTVPGQNVIAGSSEQVQTLQMALHEIELENQQLRTRVVEMESHMGIVIPYMLWMEERLTFLEKRLPGPPLGPQ
uniref:Zf-CCHC domain-containing protein/UBN2 domain-containing protein n=1 Tax=Tanacetum cinerariifolium TaxID=118510 RepID=A0A6L2M087_TANCI|nr:zf-CCHC domain-containing protein/UBN2 domain-containing protein [Tanacetum cinerariifolium]